MPCSSSGEPWKTKSAASGRWGADNKPFTYTTKAIFSRTADREVERKLFYVEPDPESFARPERASNPNLVQAVLASLIGIPGYESITEDLRLLAEHNSSCSSTTGWSPISSPSTLQCRHRTAASTGSALELMALLPESCTNGAA